MNTPDCEVAATCAFLQGGGEMGERIRAFNWNLTTIGDPANWDPALQYTVSLILSSKLPMFIWWGEDLIQFYNDAYRPSFGETGKHPQALGQRGEECWPEIWPVIKPLIDQVFTGEGSPLVHDQLIPIYRNGALEDVYWTFSYSPIKKINGETAGVLVTCLETTEDVLQKQKVLISEHAFRETVSQAPVAICILEGNNFIVSHANQRMLELWGTTAEKVMHQPLFNELKQAREEGFEELLTGVRDTGIAYSAEEVPVSLPRGKEMRTVYSNFIYHPIRESDNSIQRIMVLAIEVTEQVNSRKILEKYNEELAASELRFKQMADTMPQFVWTSDKNGVLDYFNQAVYNYAGLNSEQLVNGGWIEIVHPEEREENLKRWTAAVTTQQPFHFEHRFKNKDGFYRWQLSRAVPTYDADGNVNRWIGTSTDIHDIKIAEQQKDNFIAIASHELKTPVTSIKVYAQLLKKHFAEQNSNRELDMSNRMGRQIDKLTGLVEELLNVTKIQSGKLQMHNERFNFNELVAEIIEQMQSITDTHRIIFHAGEEVEVNADRDRIGQVVMNLVSNAIKYSPGKDHIDITTSVQANEVVCQVTDHGIGVAKEHFENIFTQFFRVETTEKQNVFPGLGLGLYICSEIIKRENGRIWVSSSADETSFSFALHKV